MDNATIRQAQLKIFEILREIDRVCKLCGIQYYLAKGTLLGAVKYQGFIPWDDDCDIYMLREDYEKFEQEAVKVLGDKFFFQTPKTEPQRHSSISKVRMNGTKLVDNEASEHGNYHQGLFVDVFILDYYPGWAIPVGNFFNVIPTLRQKRKRYAKGSWQRNVFSAVLAPVFLLHTILEKTFIKAVTPFFRKDSRCDYICQEAKLFNGLCWKTVDFGFVTMMFEGKEFPVPKNFEDLLQRQYGLNYRSEEPPKEQQIPKHARKIEINC